MTLRKGWGSALGHRFQSVSKLFKCVENNFSPKFLPLSTGKNSPVEKSTGHTLLHFGISHCHFPETNRSLYLKRRGTRKTTSLFFFLLIFLGFPVKPCSKMQSQNRPGVLIPSYLCQSLSRLIHLPFFCSVSASANGIMTMTAREFRRGLNIRMRRTLSRGPTQPEASVFGLFLTRGRRSPEL